MHFWPFGVGILGAVCAALLIMALMMRVQRPGVVSKGPRHKWNRQKDLGNQEQREMDRRA